MVPNLGDNEDEVYIHVYEYHRTDPSTILRF
jgi:hypothetical protein